MRDMYGFLIIIFFLSSCEGNYHTQAQAPHIPSFNWQRINSRDDGSPILRYPLYSAKVPSDWIRKDPLHEESISDTTKPLVEFFIEEENEKVRITVHNFPLEEGQQNVPPIVQINRWRSQFETLDPALTMVRPQSHGGFVGLFIESQGIMNDKPTKLLGWSMQLAPEYNHNATNQTFLTKQEKADYTIKALGSPDLVTKNQDAIINFANSFELIEELPNPL